MNASNSNWPALALVLSISGFLVVCCVVGLVLALTLARGQLRRLLTTAMAVLLVVSVVLGVVMARNAAAPLARTQPGASSTPVHFPSPGLPTNARPSPSTASPSPSHPASKPSTSKPKPKPKPKPEPKPVRWTLPKRGSRPASPMFDQTWRTSDHAQRQQLAMLTFAFSIPHGYRCIQDVAADQVGCGSGFTRSDAYILIYPGTCGCTSPQVKKRVDRLLNSKVAYGRLLPVARNTRASDASNGQAIHQYWMVRLYGTGHGLNHEILVYAQANKKSDDIKMRKIIGDIYDATR